MTSHDVGLCRITVALLFVLIFSGGASAFDCKAAQTPVEIAICASPALKVADDALVRSYVAAARRTSGVNRDLLIESQRRWLKQRDLCMSRPDEKRAGCILSTTSIRTGMIDKDFEFSAKPLAIDGPGSQPTRDNPPRLEDLSCGAVPGSKAGAEKKREKKISLACGDPILLSALVDLRDTFEKSLAERPSKERAAYAHVAVPLVNIADECQLDGKLDRPCALLSAYAHGQTLRAFDGTGQQQTGRLRFIYLRRAAADGYDIHSIYAKFDKPRDAAERLFNILIVDATWQDELLNPYSEENKIATSEGQTLESFSDVSAIRDRAGLLSFAVESWQCCGAHGTGSVTNVNIIRPTGSLFNPTATFVLKDLATACWKNFYGNKGFPLLAETDQDPDAATLTSDFRVKLADLMSDQRQWSFSNVRIKLDFGSMGGYAGGASGCTLTYDDLKKVLRPGETIP